MQRSESKRQGTLRLLPSVDQLLRSLAPAEIEAIGSSRSTTFARQVIRDMRINLASNGRGEGVTRESLLDEAQARWRELVQNTSHSSLQKVLNGTGVILHTNLGRAALSKNAQAAILEASGYCNLEYDLVTGTRGRRGGQVEELLKELTGAEDALVVNNCASAALLVLTVLARGGETLVSRGELVEIGGDFRVPDVLANSGTTMMEVGTTNRTRLDDYRRALTSATRLIMRIHPSNYRIVGFTASPALEELVDFAHNAGLPLYEDAGSGLLRDLSEYGLEDEPIISESIRAGVDVVSFSGDKLLGSVQAGILVGSKAIIEKLRRHSLFRALRPDKLCLAALEATLNSHVRGTALADVPTLRMLTASSSEIKQRCETLVEQIRDSTRSSDLKAVVMEGNSAVGGGSGLTRLSTSLIALSHRKIPTTELETKLRRSSPPVIGRIAEDLLLLDLRTIPAADEPQLLNAILALSTKGQ